MADRTPASPADCNARPAAPLAPLDTFPRRHLGSGNADTAAMLAALGQPSLDALIGAAVPPAIRLPRTLDLPEPVGESRMLDELRSIATKNHVFRSFIGCGYYDCHTPLVIQRNILENPGWYTAYTPYQAEISQGRLEALLNFQTMVCDLTALEIANASMLDEGTAAAEAVHMAFATKGSPEHNTIFVAADCHPQTLAVVSTRAKALGYALDTGDAATFVPGPRHFAALIQYPGTSGDIRDFAPLVEKLHAAGALAIVATDLLALTLLRAPGEFGADIAVGSAQRFGVPLGCGGPGAGFLATRDALKRLMPGRLVGVSKDAQGQPALRLALGTREQHIRREKATSNICTAQVLLAVMASMYAVYHGPDGLKAIASRVHHLTRAFAAGLAQLGYRFNNAPVFGTLTVELGDISAERIHDLARAHRLNLRPRSPGSVGVSFDETATEEDLALLLRVFAEAAGKPAPALASLRVEEPIGLPAPFARTSRFLDHPVFNRHHTEHEMLRYIRRLEAKDLSLCHSMIPLGSCTMKLNATGEMLPITWPEFARIHPFAPAEQTAGYRRLFADLQRWLAEITGFAAVSLQPNAGSAGEYAGLLVIRAWHASRGERSRDICLIPTSAHGTNPASAAMAGLKVVPVACDPQGNIDLADLRAKAAQHAAALAAVMVTYPSTHGVFETGIRELCEIVHAHGGQVYMDGANMNAQVGLTSPGHIGADVCHLNLHKTFAIPHGGGGPGVGPICVASHLTPFLPSHPVVPPHDSPQAIGPVASAPWGSANVALISWAYIRMMGAAGLTAATKLAILNANYVARRLERAFPVVYRGAAGLVAHECIVDLRGWKQRAGIEVEDVAKRLMDYGYHAPTMSWPVAGTLMIEPTESESKQELDSFCDALLSIHDELLAIERGQADRTDNVLKRAPHTTRVVCADNWDRPYPRELAAFPSEATRVSKFWPSVGRIDNTYGDRNLVCTCSGSGN